MNLNYLWIILINLSAPAIAKHFDKSAIWGDKYIELVAWVPGKRRELEWSSCDSCEVVVVIEPESIAGVNAGVSNSQTYWFYFFAY